MNMEGKTEIGNAEDDFFQGTPKSSVKLIKNSNGVQWQIRMVKGEEHLSEGLMLKAIEIHKKLMEEFA